MPARVPHGINARRYAIARELREIMYGGPTPGPEPRPNVTAWCGIVRIYADRGAFQREELCDLARQMVTELGVNPDVTPEGDNYRRSQFVAVLRVKAKAEGRWKAAAARSKARGGMPPANRIRHEIEDEIRQSSKRELAKWKGWSAPARRRAIIAKRERHLQQIRDWHRAARQDPLALARLREQMRQASARYRAKKRAVAS